MHIRENTASNVVGTKVSYLNLTALNDKDEEISSAIPLGLADVKNGFDLKLKMANDEASLKFKEFVPNASYKFVNDEKRKASYRICCIKRE